MSATLHGHVVDLIGTRIANGTYAPESIINAGALEEEFGVSRSVIREAVRVLSSAGMLKSIKRLGTRVLPASEWNPYDPLVIKWRLTGPEPETQLRSLSELRMAIEPIAAELAAVHAPVEQRNELKAIAAAMEDESTNGDVRAYLELDISFHALILASSGNEMFAALAHPIEATLRGRTAHGLLAEHPHADNMRLHLEIAEAIANADSFQARAGMESIVRRTVAGTTPVWAGTERPFAAPHPPHG